MDSYKQMVVNWSIFTLSLQLLFCASVCLNVAANAELLCSEEPEKFVNDRGVESSLLYDLHPGKTQTLCKRMFSAPDQHGFFVRLQRPDGGLGMANKKVSSTNKSIHGGSKANSTTTTCPLQIYSSNDPYQPPWRLDPCMLEDGGMLEEPVRIMQGHLRVVWNHGGNIPSYRLMLTVLGKGEPCKDADKHPCLIFGEEKIFCISNDLVCDGVQNCPVGSEYNSDEDQDMCARRQLVDQQDQTRLNIWEHFSLGILRNIFRGDETTPQPEWLQVTKTSTPDSLETSSEEDTSGEETPNTQYTRGLSKYGPWGYLMLGMLICGGALLICGLWECCCHSIKTTVESGAGGDQPSILIETGTAHTTININSTLPPQYDDLDEPPSYSALFPVQKSSANDLTQITLPQQIIAPPIGSQQPSQSSSFTSTNSEVHNRNV